MESTLLFGGQPVLTGCFAAAEAIASRDRNNLYLTSRFFRDVRRYEAFCAYYALMRIMDDRVDDLVDRTRLAHEERRREHSVLRAWEEAIEDAYQGCKPRRSVLARCDHPDAAALIDALVESLTLFPPPFQLWANFFRSMHWDLEHDRFDSWREFLDYTEGASVAPTTIYLVLLTADVGKPLSVPVGFDLEECGRQLGRFAYLGHIARDLAEDLRTGARGLLYLTREDMAFHGVTERLLRMDLERARASAATRGLVADLLGRARDCLGRGRELMAPLADRLGNDRGFVLELIVTMYERVIEKIDRHGFDPFSGRHRLTSAEKGAVIREVANRVGFP